MKTKLPKEVPFELLPPHEQAKQKAITAWLREHGPAPEQFKAQYKAKHGVERPFRAARPVDEVVPDRLFDGED